MVATISHPHTSERFSMKRDQRQKDSKGMLIQGFTAAWRKGYYACMSISSRCAAFHFITSLADRLVWCLLSLRVASAGNPSWRLAGVALAAPKPASGCRSAACQGSHWLRTPWRSAHRVAARCPQPGESPPAQSLGEGHRGCYLSKHGNQAIQAK